MTRLLLTIFFIGLVVSAASIAAAVHFGGHWPPKFKNAIITYQEDEGDTQGEPLPEPGPVTSRPIAWTGSNELNVKFPAEVTYFQAPESKILVFGPKNWIDRIEVEGGNISMGPRRYRWDSKHPGGVKIEVWGPAVHSFDMNGAKSLVIASYDQDTLEVTVNGAASVDANGKTRALTVEMNGAGKGNFARLETSEAEITLNGAGSVKAAPTEKADLEINGVGAINLRYRPKEVHQEINGIGAVTYDNAPSQPVAPAAPASPKNLKGTAA